MATVNTALILPAGADSDAAAASLGRLLPRRTGHALAWLPVGRIDAATWSATHRAACALLTPEGLAELRAAAAQVADVALLEGHARGPSPLLLAHGWATAARAAADHRERNLARYQAAEAQRQATAAAVATEAEELRLARIARLADAKADAALSPRDRNLLAAASVLGLGVVIPDQALRAALKARAETVSAIYAHADALVADPALAPDWPTLAAAATAAAGTSPGKSGR